MKRKFVNGIIIILLLPFLAVISCKKNSEGSNPPSIPPNVVYITYGKGFSPSYLKIEFDNSVEWRTSDTAEGGHTVTGDDSSFYSGKIPFPGSYHRIFHEIGSFGYHCSNHPDERGTIFVML